MYKVNSSHASNTTISNSPGSNTLQLPISGQFGASLNVNAAGQYLVSNAVGTLAWTTPKYKRDSFVLPEDRMPRKVYVSGRLLTMGVFGSKAECVYMGRNKISFFPSIVSAVSYTTGTSIIIEYDNIIYDYILQNILHNIIDAKMLCKRKV